MDPRACTATGPRAKSWSKSSGSSSRLLRNAKVQHSAFEEVSRPRTSPAPTLTPHLHWNLNNSALHTLSKKQVEELYGLFKFYDSSTGGDALPSINCARFVEILRDARLLSGRSNNAESMAAVAEGLEVENVAKVFAQAAMGKMRVYLDADEQPALPFSQFCGAIMNCAMLLARSEHPAGALRQILPTLLECSIGNDHHMPAAKGLLRHLPTDGPLSCWTPELSQASLAPSEDVPPDFRNLPAFQQVIADCESDKVLEELRQEKVANYYAVPDRLLATFEHDTIALITEKFRLFDVSERGVLPRHEIFALLSGIGKRADLPDPYSVLPRLFASNNPMSGEDDKSGSGLTRGSEMTLAELLQAIEVTREAKRHSSTAPLASMKIRLNRALTTARQSLPLEGNTSDGIQSAVSLHDASEQNKTAGAESLHDSKEQGRRRGVLKPRKSTLSQMPDCSGVDGPNRASLHTKRPKVHTTQRLSSSSKKKSMLSGRSPSIDSNKAETIVAAAADLLSENPEVPKQSVLSGSPGADNPMLVSLPSNSDTANSGYATMAPDTIPQASSTDHEGQLESPSSIISVEVYEVPSELPSASKRKTIRIFLLLGGDHDGAMCCTMSFVISTREITEREGIYYTTGPSETTKTTSVVPIQKTLATALRMLKKRVLNRMQRGFEQRPAGQLDIVDNMLHELNKRQPHYSSPIAKTSRESALVENPRPGKAHLGLAFTISKTRQSKIARRLISASPECDRALPSRQSKRLLDSKSTHPQNKLPSNYRSLLGKWELPRDDKWVHDVNAASPLKPALYPHNQAMPCRSGHLSPLHLPSKQNNQIDITEKLFS
ncbi:unnamed protein product [Phytophthora fragariaefolia]|uniref:Unnamed protein product n=1 Tax=Phytophthora fragariaefolia TaxID=1490495 RepID=A0A9W6XI31_9STRA|nr:unnamed protein product [Phytophthora fragariaefolia]